MGVAVGFLRECKADLRAIQHSSLSRPQLRKSTVAQRALKEEESVSELLNKYTMINDTVIDHSYLRTVICANPLLTDNPGRLSNGTISTRSVKNGT